MPDSLISWLSDRVGTALLAGDPRYNQTEDEPYTLDPTVLHAVLDGVARAIEAVQNTCV